MRARRVIALLVLAVSQLASAGERKPTAVDVKPLREKMIVFEDAQGGTYIVVLGNGDSAENRMWYGTGGGKARTVYEQLVISEFHDGGTGAWSIGVWAPRVTQIRPGQILRKQDGALQRSCGDKDAPLTQLTADRAKAIVDKATFMTTALVRKPHLLARD